MPPDGWSGVVHQNNSGKIKSFERVIYKAKDTELPFKEGQLLRCIYKLDSGQMLDLRLLETRSKARPD